MLSAIIAVLMAAGYQEPQANEVLPAVQLQALQQELESERAKTVAEREKIGTRYRERRKPSRIAPWSWHEGIRTTQPPSMGSSGSLMNSGGVPGRP